MIDIKKTNFYVNGNYQKELGNFKIKEFKRNSGYGRKLRVVYKLGSTKIAEFCEVVECITTVRISLTIFAVKCMYEFISTYEIEDYSYYLRVKRGYKDDIVASAKPCGFDFTKSVAKDEFLEKYRHLSFAYLYHENVLCCLNRKDIDNANLDGKLFLMIDMYNGEFLFNGAGRLSESLLLEFLKQVIMIVVEEDDDMLGNTVITLIDGDLNYVRTSHNCGYYLREYLQSKKTFSKVKSARKI